MLKGAVGFGAPCAMHLCAGQPKNGEIGELEEAPGLSAGAWRMRPLSRGYVEAKSNPTWTAGRDFAIENGRNAGG